MTKISIGKQKLDKICFAKDETKIFGANQGWFPSRWQQAAGCAATAAATMFVCFDDAVLPVSSVEEWLLHMQKWWDFLTPGFVGINRVRKFTFGAEQFFKKHCLPYKTRSLTFPCGAYPPIATAVDFLVEGLQQGCPVAFLNLSNSLEKTLSLWHWVTVVALDVYGEKVVATIFDEGKKIDIDFSLWHQTATYSGALAFFTKELQKKQPESKFRKTNTFRPYR